MVIVDTSVWVDYVRGGSSAESLWLDRELSRRRIGLTEIILLEVLQGAENDVVAKRIEKELTKFAVWSSPGTALVVAAARNYRSLRSQGHTVRKTIDCLIATFCIEAGHDLLHRDRDFEPFERFLGLRVVRA
jgi:predicted nucleic acid-binding protein